MRHTSDNLWRDVLHARFRGQPTPLLVMPDALWTAASLWAGTRAWTKAFREVGFVAGDVIGCDLPAGPAFVQVLLACLWEGITFAPQCVGGEAPTDRRHTISAHVADAESDYVTQGGLPLLVPDAAGQPPARLPALMQRPSATPGIALLAADDDAGAAIAFSAASLLEAARVAELERRLDGACVLSVLPWHRSGVLISDVLAPLLHADDLVVAGDTTLETALRLSREHPVTHLSLDAATCDMWRADEDGQALLSRLTVRIT